MGSDADCLQANGGGLLLCAPTNFAASGLRPSGGEVAEPAHRATEGRGTLIVDVVGCGRYCFCCGFAHPGAQDSVAAFSRLLRFRSPPFETRDSRALGLAGPASRSF